MANIGGADRVLRVCDLCGGVDDHPRHVIAGSVDGVFRPSDAALDRVLAEAPEDRRAELVRDLLDTTSSDRHLQCCRDAGCPQQPPFKKCDELLEGAGDKIGADLLDFFVEQQAENVEG